MAVVSWIEDVYTFWGAFVPQEKESRRPWRQEGFPWVSAAEGFPRIPAPEVTFCLVVDTELSWPPEPHVLLQARTI